MIDVHFVSEAYQRGPFQDKSEKQTNTTFITNMWLFAIAKDIHN